MRKSNLNRAEAKVRLHRKGAQNSLRHLFEEEAISRGANEGA